MSRCAWATHSHQCRGTFELLEVSFFFNPTPFGTNFDTDRVARVGKWNIMFVSAALRGLLNFEIILPILELYHQNVIGCSKLLENWYSHQNITWRAQKTYSSSTKNKCIDTKVLWKVYNTRIRTYLYTSCSHVTWTFQFVNCVTHIHSTFSKCGFSSGQNSWLLVTPHLIAVGATANEIGRWGDVIEVLAYERFVKADASSFQLRNVGSKGT